jgi:hypothetical protein
VQHASFGHSKTYFINFASSCPLIAKAPSELIPKSTQHQFNRSRVHNGKGGSLFRDFFFASNSEDVPAAGCWGKGFTAAGKAITRLLHPNPIKSARVLICVVQKNNSLAIVCNMCWRLAGGVCLEKFVLLRAGVAAAK